MFTLRTISSALAVATLLASGASANPILTFGFNELDADFAAEAPGGNSDASNGTLAVSASATSIGGPFDSSGDVSRIVQPTGTASFNAGFAAGTHDADFALEMNLSDITDDSATATGTFTITDANGDQLRGELDGTWERLHLFGVFAGVANNIQFDLISGDNTFNGPSGGGFGLDLPFGPIYDGALVSLQTGSWFDDSFENVNFQATAAVAPEPNMLAAGVVLGLCFCRPRRIRSRTMR